MDGRILHRPAFDPDAPEISAEVALLTGSNLHEILNGLDRAETQAMPIDELHQLVSQDFGEHSQRIIDAYKRDYPQATPFDLYATMAAASFRSPACEQAIRKAALRRHPRTLTYMPGALRCWTDAPGHFKPLNLRPLSIMLNSVIITVRAALRQSSYQNKSVLLG